MGFAPPRWFLGCKYQRNPLVTVFQQYPAGGRETKNILSMPSNIYHNLANNCERSLKGVSPQCLHWEAQKALWMATQRILTNIRHWDHEILEGRKHNVAVHLSPLLVKLTFLFIVGSHSRRRRIHTLLTYLLYSCTANSPCGLEFKIGSAEMDSPSHDTPQKVSSFQTSIV